MRSLLRRLSVLDVVIATAVTVALEVEVGTEHLTPQAVAIGGFAVAGAALLLRRIAPLLALLMGQAAFLVATVSGVPMHKPVTPLFFYVLVLYSIGLRERRLRATAGLVAALVVVAVTMLVARYNGEGFDLTDAPFVGLVVAAPWFVGRAMRSRLHESVKLGQRAERLEREQLAAIADERARIARELHDVIAHSVSVMVVLAGAAEEVLKADPARALEPLRSVQETGRQALVEMSRLVGLLREDSTELGLAPQPRLDELPALLEQMRDAGLPVELRIEGERRALPLGVELTAYRVVQEALTNVLKHAGRAHADVRLRYGVERLELEVVDDGNASGNGHVGGHGLAGMRERARVFGGDLEAGSRPDGGFSVRVWLPFEGHRA